MDDNYFEVEESAPLLPEDQQPGEARQADLEPEGPRPPAWRKRATQIGLALAALLAVAVIFRGVIPSANQAPDGQATSQSIPALPTVLIESNINFGTVSINGQRQRGKLPLLFEARNSAYRITIEAPPFSVMSCTIIFFDGAPENDGSCNFASGDLSSITTNGVTAIPDYSIELDFLADNLPQDQQDQINTLLAQSISQQQTTTVPAGSYIATSFNADSTITSQRVTTPVQATASLVASDNFGPQEPASCTGLICQGGIDPEQYASLTGNVWVISVPVALRWRFTTTAGQVLSDVSFPIASLQVTLLAYSPDTGWSISAQSAATPFTIPDQLNNLDCQTGGMVVQQQTQEPSIGYNIVDGQGIEGCEIDLLDTTGGANGNFVWRFGVLLAADSTAHTLLPHLPIAPQTEINAVQPRLLTA